jgi:hypothetical protein
MYVPQGVQNDICSCENFYEVTLVQTYPNINIKLCILPSHINLPA